ncbi:mitochondrial inner membrane protein required for protein import [Lobosporangium transversale]|uniref:Mitochondrial import inner membrane translocase subunit TIM50 n=1 Tax=Lobosporangium transversale TaxID=64571 RepID=A0A1Y2GLN0_9FUNG|nr:HAD-like domain-containing protein [Lobosporangium transversale]KAF9913755.1 mitochondrial inner membrane protein required for protein import [Lobosporangium transversale]ORZ14865.1 HAD-like domain-containing protein [Lobosporangium transversale]|eukprot:XP_021880997.1 HAD-like domain-containing protein [Lobosporangium transversale]
MASIARNTLSRSLRPTANARLSPVWAARRTYATPVNEVGNTIGTNNSSNSSTSNAVRNLAAEALAQKTGHGPTQPTVPKGKNKPSKIEKTPTSPAVYALYALLGISAVGLAYNVGCPYPDEEGVKDAEKHPDESFLAGYVRRAQERYKAATEKMANPIWDKLLPDPLPEPYQQRYTLVINLDNTLIHSTWDKDHGWRVAKRPGAEYFLAYLFQHYEIVIFTTQTADTALRILDKLDPYQYAVYRLFRESTRYIDGKYVKDLSHLNRDLSKVIIMDSNPDAYSLQPENSIAMKPWTGDPNDTELVAMIPFLETIALTEVEDVRGPLAKFRGKNIPVEFAKWEEELKEQMRLQWEEEQKNKKGKGLGIFRLGSQQQEQPPVPLFEQQRQQFQEHFKRTHKVVEEEAAQNLKKQKELESKLKSMKISVWDIMTKGGPDPAALAALAAETDNSTETSQPSSGKA